MTFLTLNVLGICLLFSRSVLTRFSATLAMVAWSAGAGRDTTKEQRSGEEPEVKGIVGAGYKGQREFGAGLTLSSEL